MYEPTSVVADPSAQMSPVTIIIYLVIVALIVAAMWKLFTKANKPGWAALVPIYNTVVLLEVVKRPIWWLVLLLIPFVNIVVSIMVMHDLSKAFGKGVGMTVLNVFLPFIGIPILACGSATYQYGDAPVAAAPAEQPPQSFGPTPPSTPAV